MKKSTTIKTAKQRVRAQKLPAVEKILTAKDAKKIRGGGKGTEVSMEEIHFSVKPQKTLPTR